MNKSRSMGERHVTRLRAACVAQHQTDNGWPPGWPQSAFRDGAEIYAPTQIGKRVIPEGPGGDCADAKVDFHRAHGWYFSPVDLAIGQDRRKRGLGAFMFTIEPDSPFDQGMIKPRCFGLQMKSRDEFESRPMRRSFLPSRVSHLTDMETVVGVPWCLNRRRSQNADD